jgi:transposase
MTFRKISADMKQRALQLIDEGWELEEVAEVLGVSSKSVERWENNYEVHGRVDPPSVLRGRPRLLTAQAIDDLHQLIQESPYLFLDEIGEWLALYHDQPISTTALHDNLREIGLTRKLMRKAAAERDPVARAEWLAYVTSTYSAEQMVILDESSKDGRTITRRYGRAPAGERPVMTQILNRGIRYSILPALTVNGYLSVRVVEGSINGAEFYDFVVNDVVILFFFNLSFFWLY